MIDRKRRVALRTTGCGVIGLHLEKGTFLYEQKTSLVHHRPWGWPNKLSRET